MLTTLALIFAAVLIFIAGGLATYLAILLACARAWNRW